MVKTLINTPSSLSDHRQHYDALIIGQGLAGSLLAWEMAQQGLQVMVLDNQHYGSSSVVAAGIINPITGHRINMTDRFSEFMSIAKNTYEEIRRQLKINFSLMAPIAQQRLIKNPGQKSYYEKRLNQKEYNAFLHPHKANASINDDFFRHTEFGVAEIKQTYRVETNKLLNALQQWLIQKNALIQTQLDYDQLIIKHDMVEFQQNDLHICAKQIIFCEGFQAIYNPWLKTLPFKLAKGDILTIELDRACDSMLNWGHWLLPNSTTNRLAKLGSSFQWNDTSLTTENSAAQKLISNLQQHCVVNSKLITHQTGIRPTTLNRQPFIGFHPEHQNLFCFNGFGSKGCLTIPYYAKKFALHFSEQDPLDSLFPQLNPNLSVS